MKRIAVIVPVYNEESVLPQMAMELRRVLDTLQIRWTVLFVDDGSTDKSAEILKLLGTEDTRFAIVTLARNFGHQIAVTAGLDIADCDVAITMDCDLQDPPTLIPVFLSRWQSGFDIVAGVRQKRQGESLFKRVTASIFYVLLKQLGGATNADNSGDFRLYSDRTLAIIRSIRERNRYLRGLSDWTGLSRTTVIYDRHPRAAGNTKYTLSKMMHLAFSAISSFSTSLFDGFAFVGTIVICLGITVLIGAIANVITNNAYLTLQAFLVVLGGIAMIAIAGCGKYLIVIYEEVRRRPLYVIDGMTNVSSHGMLPTDVIFLPAKSNASLDSPCPVPK